MAVDELSETLGVRVTELETPDTFMTWPDVARLAAQGVAFGGHGAEHKQLATVPAAVVDEEVERSKEALQQWAAPPVWTFSYPNGSCNDAVAERVRAHGFEAAFTTRGGSVTCDDDPLFVRRVNVHEHMTQSAALFLGRVIGLL
jgi:peptidoglycan/xylan/chitin deacetylase (PgdA/CDA1 family)